MKCKMNDLYIQIMFRFIPLEIVDKNILCTFKLCFIENQVHTNT